jgi:F-type H+-transporting ATPase subunit epsilon
MPKTFRLSIVSPDRTVVDEPCSSLIVPGRDGYLGVLAGHMPLLTELRVGHVAYTRADGVRVRVAIGGGFMQVDGRKAVVLADTAEKADEIDPDRARVAVMAAREALAALPKGDPKLAESRAALERAENRLKLLGEEP